MTIEGSAAADPRPGDGHHPRSAHQGPGRWAQRGATGIGMLPDESPADGGDPDISPSLAGGHDGPSSHEQD